MISLLAIGFISVLGQVVLLREISVAFFGVELIYSLAIAIWLLWSAAGASLGRQSLTPSPAGIGGLFILFGLLLPVEIGAIRSLRMLLAPARGAFMPFPLQILSMTLSLLPAGILSGWIFQRTAKRFIREGRTLAQAYAVECLGALGGGIASVAFFHYGIQNFSSAVLCAILSAAIPLAPSKAGFGIRIRSGSFIAISLLAFALLFAQPLDRWMTGWNHPNLIESRDSPYSRITLTRLESQISVFENDTLSFETEGVSAEEFVHLAALQSTSLSRVLILGGGIEGLVDEALHYRPASVDYIELNPVLLELFRRHFPQSQQMSLFAKPARVSVADPRQFLASSSARYDLILLGMAEPSSGQSNRFYTEEFFALCAAHLSDGGVFSLRLRAAENLWTYQMKLRMASIRQSLSSAFADILFFPGSTCVVLASQHRLIRDPDLLVARFQNRAIKTRLVSPAYLRYQFNNDRFAEIAQTLHNVVVSPNTDSMPMCYQLSVLIWLSKFFPAAGYVDVSAFVQKQVRSGPVMWIGSMSVLIAVILLRIRPALRRFALVAFAAFSGMVIEIVLILHYQVKCGVLYQNIGILLAAFMLGLALGCWSTDRICGEHGASLSRIAGLTLIGLLVLIGAVLAWGIGRGWFANLAGCGTLLILAGFAVAGVFAHAASQEREDQRRAVAPLYASDLIGGCLGSIAASLLLIPFFGLSVSAAVTIPITTIAALLL